VAIATEPSKPVAWQHIAVNFDAGPGTQGTFTIHLDGKAVFVGSFPIAKRAASTPTLRAPLSTSEASCMVKLPG